VRLVNVFVGCIAAVVACAEPSDVTQEEIDRCAIAPVGPPAEGIVELDTSGRFHVGGVAFVPRGIGSYPLLEHAGTGREDEIGRGAAAGSKLNIPVAPGANDEVFEAEWPRVLEHLRKHEPEFILLQAGADSVEGDPITHMRFSPETHRRAARDLARLAEELGHGRVLGTGGGGYNRINLAQAWSRVVQGLLE
jgi:hypothetical protein